MAAAAPTLRGGLTTAAWGGQAISQGFSSPRTDPAVQGAMLTAGEGGRAGQERTRPWLGEQTAMVEAYVPMCTGTSLASSTVQPQCLSFPTCEGNYVLFPKYVEVCKWQIQPQKHHSKQRMGCLPISPHFCVPLFSLQFNHRKQVIMLPWVCYHQMQVKAVKLGLNAFL